MSGEGERAYRHVLHGHPLVPYKGMGVVMVVVTFERGKALRCPWGSRSVVTPSMEEALGAVPRVCSVLESRH